MLSRLKTRALLIAALEATQAFAVVLGFPPSGTSLQRGSQVTATWGKTTILTMTIGLRNASNIFPIVNNVDAQSFRATFTLPEFALGDYTLALLNNVTLDMFAGNTVHIVDNTSTSTSGPTPSSTPSPMANQARRESLSAGSIVGIVFGAIAALGILGVLLVQCARRMHTRDANLDPFDSIHAEGSGTMRVPDRRTKGSPSQSRDHDGQGSLVLQIAAARKQLENASRVGEQPDRAVDQNWILQSRIRMLERELESLGGDPPPQYLAQN
ncbi:hypothetical protein MSAN_00519900 [Mycena sanguinolenta]|uniref:Uncharacterized protein n=1 Tax=Mycena sanguinolenta TaxID=230812 RepID=A0A8H7DJ11_9AGAR|nr:hypothetical protein MSAN_00519900 [Mycena sanguinolenta]